MFLILFNGYPMVDDDPDGDNDVLYWDTEAEAEAFLATRPAKVRARGGVVRLMKAPSTAQPPITPTSSEESLRCP